MDNMTAANFLATGDWWNCITGNQRLSEQDRRDLHEAVRRAVVALGSGGAQNEEIKSMTIYKYPLEWAETQTISMPAGAEPFALQSQGGVPALWAKVDAEATLTTYVVRIYGTGVALPNDPGHYLGTVQAGAFVFHFFWEGQP